MFGSFMKSRESMQLVSIGEVSMEVEMEMSRIELPTLYKKSAKTGAVQQWSVYSLGNVVLVTQGQVGGALQEYSTICKGKNSGRANATSDSEQATKEAQAKWEKQLKKGYVEDPSGESQIKLPMKVNEYQKHKNKIKFPCTISPKLNGVNSEFRYQPRTEFLSRGGELYPEPPAQAVEEMMKLCDTLQTNSLNYEIYKHGKWLQDITGAVKAPHNHPELHSELEYHVFDLPQEGILEKSIWSDRCKKLTEYSDALECMVFEYVRVVPSVVCNSHEEIEKWMHYYLLQGYEGSVIRNMDGVYEYNTRSYDVLKYKIPKSAEFLITSYFTDKLNQPVFWCQSEGGAFKVKPKGTKAQRQQILEDADNWVGKYMTVEFEMYSKDGKPLKPVGIGLREGYVENGKFIPTE